MDAAFERGFGHRDTFGWHDHSRAEHGWRQLDGVVCADLVASATLGRIAFTHQALPVVLPVALRSPRSPLRFEVGDGALLDAARLAQVVCFQTDSGDVGEGSWSVAIVGHLSVHSESLDAAGAPAALIELSAELVTGRSRHATAV